MLEFHKLYKSFPLREQKVQLALDSDLRTQRHGEHKGPVTTSQQVSAGDNTHPCTLSWTQI